MLANKHQKDNQVQRQQNILPRARISQILLMYMFSEWDPQRILVTIVAMQQWLILYVFYILCKELSY